MRFFIRNFHILAFSIVWLVAAYVVGSAPHQVRDLLNAIVSDATEIRDLAHNAYEQVSYLADPVAAGEAVRISTATALMPSIHFRALANRLNAVDEKMSGHAGAGLSALSH